MDGHFSALKEIKKEHKIAGIMALAVPALLMAAAINNLNASNGGHKTAKAQTPVQFIEVSAEPAPAPLPDMTALEQATFQEQIATNFNRMHTQKVEVRAGATLSKLLDQAGVARGEAARAISALSAAYNPRQLRAGQMLTLYLQEADAADGSDGKKAGERFHLAGLATRPDVTRTILLEREHDGGFFARELVMDLETGLARASGSINASLYVDGLGAGADDAVIASFVQLFAYSVDFQRGIRAGDSFDMVFEDFRDDRGNTIKSGELLFAMLAPRGKEKAFYRYETPDGEVGYYDADGQSAKRFLMKTPVKGARLSSSFGRRKHPVLGYTRMHKGTDFAAVRGTPIMAAGNGIVERASRYGSFGNYVRIRHANGYQTAYAHLSRYGGGVRSGRRVSQGQIIGYVGATGRVTGAHLHYEVHKNGKQVNPMTVKVPTGRKLNAKELKSFAKEKARIETLIEEARPANAGPATTSVSAG